MAWDGVHEDTVLRLRRRARKGEVIEETPSRPTSGERFDLASFVGSYATFNLPGPTTPTRGVSNLFVASPRADGGWVLDGMSDTEALSMPAIDLRTPFVFRLGSCCRHSALAVGHPLSW